MDFNVKIDERYKVRSKFCYFLIHSQSRSCFFTPVFNVFRYVYLGFVDSENKSEHNPLLTRQIVLVSATRRMERLALISVIHGEESGHAIDRSFAQIHAPRIGAGISRCRFHSARVGVPLTGKDQRSSCGRRYTHNWPSSLETQSDRYLFVIRNLAGSRSWRTRPS